MRTKRKTYGADFKAKMVLDVLEGEKIVNEIASEIKSLKIQKISIYNH